MGIDAFKAMCFFLESVIRDMSLHATLLAHNQSAVNLAQGFPDFPVSSMVW